MRIALQDTPYSGRTSPRPWGSRQPSLDCRRCGPSLVGRREKVRQQTTAGIRLVVETFRCRCTARRHIKREVAA
jgi:hypothetical protein